jgi:hypothetical protein
VAEGADLLDLVADAAGDGLVEEGGRDRGIGGEIDVADGLLSVNRPLFVLTEGIHQ